MFIARNVGSDRKIKNFDDMGTLNNFDFVGRVIKTPRLFYFRSVKFHCVEETHMILVAFCLW